MSIGDWANIDTGASPDPYVAYLDRARDRMLHWKFLSYRRLGLGRGDLVLDIGCGTGDDVRDLAALVGSSGLAVGVDASYALLQEAVRRSSMPAAGAVAVRFVAADAHQLPFVADTFAACRADRVLQHLDQPDHAIAEVVRVTRPGGRIFVSEPDADMTAIDADDIATTRAILSWRSEERRTNFLGRQVKGMLVHAGLLGVGVEATVDVADDFQLVETTMGLRASLERAVTRGVVAGHNAEAWLADLDLRSKEGRFLVAWVRFSTVGTKPPVRRRPWRQRLRSVAIVSRWWLRVRLNGLGERFRPTRGRRRIRR